MKVKTTIVFEWWLDGNSRKPISDSHKEELRNSAIETIPELIADGFTSGRLTKECSSKNCHIHHSGFWSVKTEETQ